MIIKVVQTDNSAVFYFIMFVYRIRFRFLTRQIIEVQIKKTVERSNWVWFHFENLGLLRL